MSEPQPPSAEAVARRDLTSILRHGMTRQRLTVEQLARRSGLGRTTVSQALNDNGSIPTDRTLRELARALHLIPEQLIELRRTCAQDPARIPDPDGEFESRYLTYLARRHSKLEIIGLDLSHDRSRWPLDTAYLSLELSTAPGAIGRHDQTGTAPTIRVQRAEDTLAGLDRVLIRGLAGSGKTTLLQWLTVVTAKRQLPSQLKKLSEHIPFLMPLRTLARRRSLPSPAEFLAHLDCPLTATQPAGWADRVLSSGRGMLLLDGVDEVPQADRRRTYQWLDELLAVYPNSFFAMTTRPTAVQEGQLAREGFAELTVRPMGSRDVAVFIDRWHEAARDQDTTPEEAAHLSGLAERLKDTVRAQPNLSQLATTPLLCALICALHRTRRGHLPRGRKALYDAALSMLLVRRDDERDVLAPEGITLDEQQSIHLLQRLAYWMIRNGQAEADRTDAEHEIATAFSAMPAVAEQGDAPAVLAHLIARTGLLRQPTAETIDFIHRTFQDYLGAKAAVEARDFGLLDCHAEDDQWEDVLRMAVAHSRPDEARRIINDLIERGDRAARRQQARLHLLAATCLEHAVQLDPAIRADTVERVTRLVPPRSWVQAGRLVAFGTMVLDLLPGPEGLDDQEQAFVVHTALGIGGEAAIPFLKRYRGATGPMVWSELGSGWDSSRTDPQEYVREILAHCPGDGQVTVRTPAQLAHAPSARSFPTLRIQGSHSANALIRSGQLAGRDCLFLIDNDMIDSLEFLRQYPQLTRLELNTCPAITGLAPLADLPLTSLGLDLTGIQDLEVLASFDRLKRLRLAMPVRYPTLAELPAPTGLTVLELLDYPSESQAITGIERFQHLTHLTLPADSVGDLAELNDLPMLTSVMLIDPGPALRGSLPRVTDVALHRATASIDLARLRRTFPALTSLSIAFTGPFGILDLTPLCGIRELTIAVWGECHLIGGEGFPPGTIKHFP
ncbi:NACHT domain-containing protein [Kitasatospora sp. NPDC056783]|uniref:NACHT domain-containing protein n=1 Tax=Kitasatospora sp. NPDC056783 TaxID=3345943 RepID=UPI0036A05F9D